MYTANDFLAQVSYAVCRRAYLADCGTIPVMSECIVAIAEDNVGNLT